MTDTIPSFFVYGEPEQQLEPGFFHVETVMARRNLHQGQVRAHKHDQMGQITFWLSGRGTYFIDDRPLDFSAPAVSFVPSGIVHGFSVDPETSDAVVVSIADGALLSIRQNATLSLDTPTMIRGDGEDRGWRRLAELLDIIADEYGAGGAGAQQMLASLVAAVLTQIARLASATPAGQPTQAVLATQLRRLVDLHFRENWSVGHYTEALATTPHLIAKASREAFGMQVKELINERRLLEAKRLLLFTVRSLEDIAYEIGFADAAYFSRFFRLRVGEAPSDWRRARVNAPGAG